MSISLGAYHNVEQELAYLDDQLQIERNLFNQSWIGRSTRWIADVYNRIVVLEKTYPTALLGVTVGSFISNSCASSLLSGMHRVVNFATMMEAAMILYVAGVAVLCVTALLSSMIREEIVDLIKFFTVQLLCGMLVAIMGIIIGLSHGASMMSAGVSGALGYLLLYLPRAHDNSALFGVVHWSDLFFKFVLFLVVTMIWEAGL